MADKKGRATRLLGTCVMLERRPAAQARAISLLRQVGLHHEVDRWSLVH